MERIKRKNEGEKGKKKWKEEIIIDVHVCASVGSAGISELWIE
jgi:hypothetical protein